MIGSAAVLGTVHRDLEPMAGSAGVLAGEIPANNTPAGCRRSQVQFMESPRLFCHHWATGKSPEPADRDVCGVVLSGTAEPAR